MSGATRLLEGRGERREIVRLSVREVEHCFRRAAQGLLFGVGSIWELDRSVASQKQQPILFRCPTFPTEQVKNSAATPKRKPPLSAGFSFRSRSTCRIA
eukprot:3260170-Prymnesium_polylepis.1